MLKNFLTRMRSARHPLRPREPFMADEELKAKLRLETTATQDAIVELLARMEERVLTRAARPDTSPEEAAQALHRIAAIRELQDDLVFAINAAKTEGDTPEA